MQTVNTANPSKRSKAGIDGIIPGGARDAAGKKAGVERVGKPGPRTGSGQHHQSQEAVRDIRPVRMTRVRKAGGQDRPDAKGPEPAKTGHDREKGGSGESWGHEESASKKDYENEEVANVRSDIRELLDRLEAGLKQAGRDSERLHHKYEQATKPFLDEFRSANKPTQEQLEKVRDHLSELVNDLDRELEGKAPESEGAGANRGGSAETGERAEQAGDETVENKTLEYAPELANMDIYDNFGLREKQLADWDGDGRISEQDLADSQAHALGLSETNIQRPLIATEYSRLAQIQDPELVGRMLAGGEVLEVDMRIVESDIPRSLKSAMLAENGNRSKQLELLKRVPEWDKEIEAEALPLVKSNATEDLAKRVGLLNARESEVDPNDPEAAFRKMLTNDDARVKTAKEFIKTVLGADAKISVHNRDELLDKAIKQVAAQEKFEAGDTVRINAETGEYEIIKSGQEQGAAYETVPLNDIWDELKPEDLGLDSQTTRRTTKDGEEYLQTEVTAENGTYRVLIDRFGDFSVKVEGETVSGKIYGNPESARLITDSIKQHENPFKDKWRKRYGRDEDKGYIYEKHNEVEGVFTDTDRDGRADNVVFTDLEGNRVLEKSLKTGSALEVERARQELRDLMAKKEKELHRLENAGITKTVLQEAGINPWQEDLSGKGQTGEKVDFLLRHAEDTADWERVLEVVRFMKDMPAQSVGYEEVFQHWEGLQGLRSDSTRVRGYLDLVKDKDPKEALAKIFGISVSDANLDGHGSSFTIHKAKGPAVALKVRLKRGRVFFGVDGPGMMNWSKGGWSMRCRANIPLTDENIQEAFTKAEEIRKKHNKSE